MPPPSSVALTSDRPLGCSPECIYASQMGVLLCLRCHKVFWPKPSLATVLPRARSKARTDSALGNMHAGIGRGQVEERSGKTLEKNDGLNGRTDV